MLLRARANKMGNGQTSLAPAAGLVDYHLGGIVSGERVRERGSQVDRHGVAECAERRWRARAGVPDRDTRCKADNGSRPVCPSKPLLDDAGRT